MKDERCDLCKYCHIFNYGRYCMALPKSKLMPERNIPCVYFKQKEEK